MVTRLGDDRVTVRADSWTEGVTVYTSVDSDGKNVFTINLTGGSSGGYRRPIAYIEDGVIYHVIREGDINA
jgi:hypothetical protein